MELGFETRLAFLRAQALTTVLPRARVGRAGREGEAGCVGP